MAQHTPAPWEYDEIGTIHSHAPDYNGEIVINFDNNSVTAADAQLIAAAPDLLAALQELVEYCGGCNWPAACAGQLILDDAVKAIAKAEGRDNR